MTSTIDIAPFRKALSQVQPLVGQTPLLFFPSLSTQKVQIYGKAEWMQIGQSVKARAAYHIMESAIEHDHLTDKTFLDASSGNTAIAYASIAARLKIDLEICLPSNASEKRKQMLLALGAKLHYTSELEGTDGAQNEAKRLSTESSSKYFYADQYNNDANRLAHIRTTAPEIWEQTDGQITHFVTGLGTSGSFVGTSEGLKSYNNRITTIALQPNSPMHFLEGWKHMPTAKVPGIYDQKNQDKLMEIDSMKAVDMVRHVAQNEGLLISPSSGANLYGASQIAKQLESGVIVTLLPDDLSKYDEVFKMIKS